MPIDKPEAVPTTRRTFLTRAALAGALVAVGTTTGPLTSLLPAGAQDAASAAPELDDAQFATLTLPLELAAVQCYLTALDNPAVGDEWQAQLGTFQTHHQAAVDALTTLLPTAPAPPAPVPDTDVLDGTGAAVQAPADEKAVLAALAELEGVLAATHLWALGGMADATTAKTVAQILAVESQHAVALGRAAGTAIAELTPDVASTTGARTATITELTNAASTTLAPTTTAPATTTTEEAGN